MNPFTRHPQQQGINYLQHARFAWQIAARLSLSVISFALHGAFPWLPIKKQHDLEATALFLQEKNLWIEASARSGRHNQLTSVRHIDAIV